MNCVIDFYRFLIFVDCLVLTITDKNQFLSTIEIIDMLRPVHTRRKFKFLTFSTGAVALNRNIGQ